MKRIFIPLLMILAACAPAVTQSNPAGSTYVRPGDLWEYSAQAPEGFITRMVPLASTAPAPTSLGWSYAHRDFGKTPPYPAGRVFYRPPSDGLEVLRVVTYEQAQVNVVTNWQECVVIEPSKQKDQGRLQGVLAARPEAANQYLQSRNPAGLVGCVVTVRR